MKKRMFVFLVVLMMMASTASAWTRLDLNAHKYDWYIDLGEYLKGTYHRTEILSADPADFGEVSGNGVLMMEGGYVGTIRAVHYTYRLVNKTKMKQSTEEFLICINPKKVQIKHAIQYGDGVVQVKWNKVFGAEYYQVSIWSDTMEIKTRETAKGMYTFRNLEPGTYWVAVVAIAEHGGEVLVSQLSKEWKVKVK